MAISWVNKIQLAKCDIMVGFSISSHILAIWHFHLYIPYTAKHSRGKTSVFRVENCYSPENFCGSMLVDLHTPPIDKAMICGKAFVIE